MVARGAESRGKEVQTKGPALYRFQRQRMSWVCTNTPLCHEASVFHNLCIPLPRAIAGAFMGWGPLMFKQAAVTNDLQTYWLFV